MAKKTNGQNPVDEAYLRSLMAGVPSEPSLSPASSPTGENGENRETALSDEKGKADDRVNETVKNVSVTDDTGCPEAIVKALETTGNDRKAAARLLGISRSTLYLKLKKYGLN